MNASYGPNGGLPTYQMDWMVADQPIIARWDPAPYSIIHQDDINEQVEALLKAASVPATLVNWGGDETPTVEEWCRYIGKLTGKTPNMQVKPMPNTLRGSVADNTKRLSLTGPCKVSWHDGIRRTLEDRYPTGVAGAEVHGQASRLLGQYKAVVDRL